MTTSVPAGTRTGLSAREARARLLTHGPNAVPPRRPPSVLRRVGRQLADPLIVVLLVAAALTGVTGDLSDTVVIALVVVVNTAVGVAQEVRADRAVAALTRLGSPRASVLRDGRRLLVATAEVVPGDLLLLAAGDLVVADADLLDAAALLVDESSVTGESVPVEKSCRTDDHQGRTEDGQRLRAGTAVVRGRGLAVVTATGAASTTGRLAAVLASTPPRTPLQSRLRRLARVLAVVVVGLSVLVGLLGLLRGQDLELMAVTAISLAVAAVPESLPAVATLSLALGARRMAAAHAVVRRLPAVETLGSVTVLATDKTGTLTEARMQVERFWTAAGGVALVPGRRLDAVAPPPSTSESAAEPLLRDALLCSDSVVGPATREEPRGRLLGDPLERALLAAATSAGLDVDAVRDGATRVAEHPFDSRRKRMTTVHRVPGGWLVVCKGSLEQLLDDGLLAPSSATSRALAAADGLATDGLRVLAVARAVRPTPPTGSEDAETGLDLVGLIALADPVRASAAGTTRALQRAGIRVVLVSGDHVATAAAVARRVGVRGRALDARAAAVPDLTGSDVGVVARATPEQKVAIVDALREAGEVVAMVGDGVNDAPALRRADVGVAMGARGTEVARQAADVVLADDELGTLVRAVAEGRRIYASIRRFLLFGLSGGCAEVLVMLAGPFVGLPLPLLPAQILWVNLLTHGLVGVALGTEPAEPGAMDRPPRPAAESVLGGGLWKRALRLGVLLAALTLLVAVWASASGREWQSLTFLTLGAAQLAVALALRPRVRTSADPAVLAAVLGALLLQLGGVYLAPLAGLLGTVPLPASDLVVVALAMLATFVGVRVERRLHRGAAGSAPW